MPKISISQLNKYNELIDKYSDKEIHEKTSQQVLCESSLHEFLKQAWPVLEGDNRFIDGPHIKAVCEHMEALYHGSIKNLIVNVPPRTCKSTICAVCFPAWVWIHNPKEQMLFASYSLELSREHSVKCRRLIESEWYQEYWGHLFKLSKDQNTKAYFSNDKGGFRKAVSSQSSVTGTGGGILFCDDINNAKDGESEVTRKAKIDWFKTTWSTRLNNRETGRRGIIMQRLHQEDITGWLLSHQKALWQHLCLPLEYEAERKCKTLLFEDWRKHEGEVLWSGLNNSDIRQLKEELGSYNYAGQYQQRPAPEEGGLIKKHWFKKWTKSYLPRFSFILQSWDTALTAQDYKHSSYSACTTWGVFRDDIGNNSVMLLSLWRDKIEQPELLKRLKRLYREWKDIGKEDIPIQDYELPGTSVDQVLIEEKSSGYYLLTECRRAGVAATQFNPNKYGDKIERVRKVTPLIETGRLWVVDNMEKLEFETKCGRELVEQCCYFPNAESRDVVDTLTQAVIRLRESGHIKHGLDQPIVVPERY